MKTPIQEIITADQRLSPAAFAVWLQDNLPYLLQTEKEQIISAWIRGNDEGWAMMTDWPEDGERYYEQNFGK